MIKKISLIMLAFILIPTIGCASEESNHKKSEWNGYSQIMPKEKSSSPVFAKNYEEAINLSENKPLLIIFGTDWCGYCVKLKKEIKDFDLTNYVICFVDADERKDLAKKFQVRSYPTSFVVKNKEVKNKKTGYKKSDYSNWIDQNR